LAFEGSRRYELASNVSMDNYRLKMEESSRMSIDQSKDKTSPNLDIQMRNIEN